MKRLGEGEAERVSTAPPPRKVTTSALAMPPLLVPEPCETASTSWASVPGVSTRCPLPAALNTRTCGVFLTVAPNQLEAVYTGQGQHSNDCGAAHGDAPVPDDLVVYYFEVEVLNHGARGTIGIGFSGSKFNMTRQPGCVARKEGVTWL